MNLGLKLTLFALVFVLAVGAASAQTIVAGTIYNSDYSQTIPGATVEVTCDGNVNSTLSLSDGTYAITYNSTECHENSTLTVFAQKGSMTGTKTGEVHDSVIMGWDLAVVNVPLVPEFGFFVGVLTIAGALIVFFVVRRR